jgi:hypothetical protein
MRTGKQGRAKPAYTVDRVDIAKMAEARQKDMIPLMTSGTVPTLI